MPAGRLPRGVPGTQAVATATGDFPMVGEGDADVEIDDSRSVHRHYASHDLFFVVQNLITENLVKLGKDIGFARLIVALFPPAFQPGE